MELFYLLEMDDLDHPHLIPFKIPDYPFSIQIHCIHWIRNLNLYMVQC